MILVWVQKWQEAKHVYFWKIKKYLFQENNLESTMKKEFGIHQK